MMLPMTSVPMTNSNCPNIACPKASQKAVVSGVLLLDKPAQISSHDALFAVKKLLMSSHHNSKKAGHTGTLDPMATGLLPLCFGEATKFAQFGLDAYKGYEAIIRLGSQTDTGDIEGQVLKTQAIPAFNQADLDKLVPRFMGVIWQVPPMYSALKKDGKKLYQYARAGIHIDRAARAITIDKLTLSKLDDCHIKLVVACSKGTYVRVLGEDIALALGSLGHLISLRRMMTAGLMVERAIKLHTLAQLSHSERLAQLLPCDVLMSHLPKVAIDDGELVRLQQGQRLNIKARATAIFSHTDNANADNANADSANTDTPHAPKRLVRLYQAACFCGLGELEHNGRLQPIKMVQV